MRSIFSLVGLLLVLVVVAMLVKRQLASPAPLQPVVVQTDGTVAGKPVVPALPPGSPQNQVDQVKQALDQAIQSRPVPHNP
jgi:hypothetical protein